MAWAKTGNIKGPQGATGATPPLSAATPQPLGTAAPGATGQASDAGHVHASDLQSTAGTSQPLGTASAGVNATAARSDHVHPGARGRVALGSVTTSDANIGTTETMTALTTNFAYDTTRRYKVSFTALIVSATAGTQVIANLRANLGSAALVTSGQIQGSQKNLPNVNGETLCYFVEIPPGTYAAGTLFLGIALKTLANTAHLAGGVTFPCQLLVEDIGT